MIIEYFNTLAATKCIYSFTKLNYIIGHNNHGHNLNLGNSGEGTDVFGDQSGMVSLKKVFVEMIFYIDFVVYSLIHNSNSVFIFFFFISRRWVMVILTVMHL